MVILLKTKTKKNYKNMSIKIGEKNVMRDQQKWQSMELQGPVPLPEKKWQITWQKLSGSTLSAN